MVNTPMKFTVAADGTSLAYQVRGSGDALVFTNGYATSSFYWKHILERFGPRARTLTWDLKGHGRSGAARTADAVSVPACADDLRRIMDAAGIERATLVGFSFGCQIVLEAWRHFPDRIDAIVPILGPYGRPFDNVFDPRVGRALYRAFERIGPRAAGWMLRTGTLSPNIPGAHEVARRLGFVCESLAAEDMRPFYEHLARIDPRTWHAMGAQAQAHTAEDLLPSIDVPVLVITGGRDIFAPAHLGEHMVARMPNAKWVHVEEASHTGLLGYAAPIGDALEAFLDALPGAPARTTGKTRAQAAARPAAPVRVKG